MKKINPESITENTFKLIGTDWFLLTAGNIESYNTMTASWGGMGVLWNRKVVFCFVRPVRHTYKFMEENEFFTLSFFAETFREALSYCGKYSGRDVNKAKETGLIAESSSNGSVFFKQAKLVLECRKLYFSDIDNSNFIIRELEKHYPDKDYHRMYIGEIVNCFEQEN